MVEYHDEQHYYWIRFKPKLISQYEYALANDQSGSYTKVILEAEYQLSYVIVSHSTTS